MGNRDECTAAEWSVSRAYGSEACSVNATVLLRRDVDLEAEEDEPALGVVGAGTLAPVGMHGEWDERDYSNATNESLVEHAHDNWDDDSILSNVNVQFMSERESDSWAHLEDDVREIQKQLLLLVRKQSTVLADDEDGIADAPLARMRDE